MRNFIYGYIYCTTDLTNGMKYIGQKKSNIFIANYYGSGKIIKAKIKARPETFRVDLIEWCYSKEELDEKEKNWIKAIGLYPLSYNLAEGGSGIILRGELNHRYGKNLTEEHRKNISASWNPNSARSGEKHHFWGVKGEDHPCFGKKRPEMSKKMRGENHHFYGKNLSEEHRQKLSDAKRGKKYGPRGPYKKRKKGLQEADYGS